MNHGYNMERRNQPKFAILIVFCFLITSMSTIVNADQEDSLTATIHSNWLGEGTHGYIIKFDRAPTAEELGGIVVSSYHQNSEQESSNQTNFTWGNGLGIIEIDEYSIMLPNQLAYGDQIDIDVFVNGTIISSRAFNPVIWTQPLADHEVTLSTHWELNQTEESAQGEDNYLLIFDGQGWQKRTASILESNELGNGTLFLSESTDEGNILFDLNLDSVWRNETTIDGLLTDSEFEMRGNGSVSVFDNSEGEMYVNITVLDALINRSMNSEIISEEFLIEGFGQLNMHQEDEDSSTEMDGAISYFKLEYYDVNGVRIKNYNDIVATAEMEQHDGDNHIYLEVTELRFFESWLDGERIGEHNLISAQGTFDISDEEKRDEDTNETEESSEGTTINGTIVHFETESIDGNTVEDYMHVYGTISGDTQGTWGLLREIEDVGPSGNDSGDIFTVNVIHNQVWYNITGAAGFFADEIGVGAYHNQTWDYQTTPIDWENRTIRYAWRTTGATADEGEEYPENSPIQNEPKAPTAESELGNITIGRESGFAPEFLLPGDIVRLDHGDIFGLDIEATGFGQITRDGHVMPVTYWSSINNPNSEGSASGSVINNGILAGLLAEVTRELVIDTDLGGAIFTEYQTLERILSPSIVTEEENNLPEIIDVSFREITLLNDAGNMAHLEVEVKDLDWNIQYVRASMSLGDYVLDNLELNDRGLDGDLAIQDDIWTIPITWDSSTHGELVVNVEVSDLFGEIVEIWNLNISNRPPELIESSLEVTQSARLSIVEISAKAIDANGVKSISVDLRPYGGELFVLTKDTDSEYWRGEFTIPNTVVPGNFAIPLSLEDLDGASIVVTGPNILITNEGPVLTNSKVTPEKIIAPEIGQMSEETYVVSVEVQDSDGLSAVQVKLHELLAGDQGESWKLMYDDGSNGDLTAGDGVYSISFQARHLPAGFVEIELRGIDIYGQSTIVKHNVIIEDEDTNIGTDPSQGIIQLLSNPVVIFSLLFVLVSIVAAVVFILRKNGINLGNFGED
ncbi:MAG: Uncharacterised protein [Methanobacteriota archaeon]|nr:MAG: Uncharacterised protein [Euryarchaeota archaeon]